jgi:hypothetical protein
LHVEVPIDIEEAEYLSVAALNQGMDLPNFLYWAGLQHANAENKRAAGFGNTKPAFLRWKRR